jgi:hypothetical protein
MAGELETAVAEKVEERTSCWCSSRPSYIVVARSAYYVSDLLIVGAALSSMWLRMLQEYHKLDRVLIDQAGQRRIWCTGKRRSGTSVARLVNDITWPSALRLVYAE